MIDDLVRVSVKNVQTLTNQDQIRDYVLLNIFFHGTCQKNKFLAIQNRVSMKSFKCLFIGVVLLVFPNISLWSQDISLDQIVYKTITKIADGKEYSYHFKSYAKGKLAQKFPITKGKVKVVLRANDYSGGLEKARIVAKDARGFTNVTINQGLVYSVVDARKKVYRSPRYRAASALFNEQLLLPVYALKDLKDASKKQGKLLEERSFAGQACWVVQVVSEGNLTLNFWLSKQNQLIRKIEATTPIYTGSTLIMEFADVKVGQAVEPANYVFHLPKGYEIIEYSGKYPPIGSIATDWEITTYNGKPLQLSKLRGKVVLLDFWATWCRPCLQAMPHLQKLYTKYRSQGLEVIGLTTQEKGNPEAVAQKLNISYTIANGNKVADQYKINGLPFAVIIGRDGKIIDYFNGYMGSETNEMMQKIVEKALKLKE